MYNYSAIKDCVVTCSIHSSIRKEISAVSATAYRIDGETKFNVFANKVVSMFLAQGDYISSKYPLEISAEWEGKGPAMIATIEEFSDILNGLEDIEESLKNAVDKS